MSFNHFNGGLSDIDLNDLREYQNTMARKRGNARMQRSMLARNALATQMVLKGRGPKSPANTPRPKRTEGNVISDILMKHMNNENTEEKRVETQAEIKAALLAFYEERSRAGAAGGAGAASPVPENTSTLSILPNATRNLIASYLSGENRNHLKSIKTKIAKETAKLRRRHKNRTRRI